MASNSNIAIVLLSVSVLLACASLYVVGSPGPLSGLKNTGTCTDIFDYQETTCPQEFDKDIFFSACVWIGFCCKCLGLLSAIVYKCKTEEENCGCQALSSMLTLASGRQI
ncbi:hypothetical protein PoB_004513500 [Plakobranchus ocellatus]|uniref:Uncharacterized protein n=1 Tax=Plakobranchus ocellatus TaxID=259542 RepID=A0AAV4BHR1_9GAST|nr:hypothetical protein PoB_004513500 [Plakobranchus ocellatus]